MARADLLRRLFESYQRRDDSEFRRAAGELIEEEKKKHHSVVAAELQRALGNGLGQTQSIHPLHPPPLDSERKTPLFHVRTPHRFLDELILDPTLRAWLDRLMLEFRSWEVLEANGLFPVRRVLLCGPSGCGKTAAAEALASELGLPLVYVRFDAVVSSLLGETAANLRKVFDYARRGQWVVFFDEFDAIGRSRDDATEHGEIKRVVNTFLQLLDGFDGRSLVVAATNFVQVLDPAIWRRFDQVLRFDLPTDVQLSALVRKQVHQLAPTDEQVERMVLALGGRTFADAELLCLDVRRSCAIGGAKRLTDSEILDALERFQYRKDALEKAIPKHVVPEVERG